MSEQGMERVSLADVQFPLRVRVRTGVWAPAFVMAVVLWVLFVPIILGVPSSVFDGESPMLLLLRVLAGIGFLPLSLYVAYTWMAWRRPRHLRWMKTRYGLTRGECVGKTWNQCG